ncbi:hypothetical protein RHMOL_Rhmol02G0102700 [Rhododendron molle]|uniref:Uncharacterized protein n=1 Tax=Rhododendron molle TaxID=49168 RepID=A0ACC0PNM8_RHOML|nr:hypothetical protein RHMOL_Rhmol02G0102700 [Rhododendron molle]
MSLGNVLHLSAEGEFALGTYGEIDCTKLVAYNPKKETLTDLVVGGIPIEFTDGDNYIETLVSPNLLIMEDRLGGNVKLLQVIMFKELSLLDY